MDAEILRAELDELKRDVVVILGVYIEKEVRHRKCGSVSSAIRTLFADFPEISRVGKLAGRDEEFYLRLYSWGGAGR